MKNKIMGIVCIYIIFIFIYIDNNSNIEISFKVLILSIIILLLSKNESKKIFSIFHFLFFIFYFLFFIFYFSLDSESDKHITNFLFIIVSLLFPIYSLVSLNIIRINYKYFLRYNGIFLVVVLIFFLRNSFGFESGIDNMIYTKLDIFLFILSLIQLVVTGYFFIYERNVLPNISDE